MSFGRRASEWPRALQIFESMAGRDVVSYGAAANAFGKGLRWREAIDLLLELPLRRIEASTVAFNASIGCMARLQLWQHTLALLKAMGGLRAPPSTVSAFGLAFGEPHPRWPRLQHGARGARGPVAEGLGALWFHGKAGAAGRHELQRHDHGLWWPVAAWPRHLRIDGARAGAADDHQPPGMRPFMPGSQLGELKSRLQRVHHCLREGWCLAACPEPLRGSLREEFDQLLGRIARCFGKFLSEWKVRRHDFEASESRDRGLCEVTTPR